MTEHLKTYACRLLLISRMFHTLEATLNKVLRLGILSDVRKYDRKDVKLNVLTREYIRLQTSRYSTT